MKSSRAKVLVVDYKEDVLIEIERLLQDQGFETETFWSAQEALRAAQTGQFDLVLVNEYLPDIAVEEFIRGLAPGVPCIVMSPGRCHTDSQHFRSIGAIELICRIPPQTVVQVVRAQTERKHPATGSTDTKSAVA